MPETFGGDSLPPCAAIARSGCQSRVKRPFNVPSPAAWLALVVECWQGTKSLGWNAYQAMAACSYSEVVQFKQKLLLWPTLVEGIGELGKRGITPEEVIKILELALMEHRLSVKEVVELEECVLAYVDQKGRWK
jgi:hypothetical protein